MKDISDYFGSPRSTNCHDISVQPKMHKKQNQSHNKNENADLLSPPQENTEQSSLTLSEGKIELLENHETSCKSKVNAFYILMDSRNNIIGQNSGGKVVEHKEKSPNMLEERKKLESRKNVFENWAEQKGASKRKRKELEIDKHINGILEKRAKKLKKMLHIADKGEELDKGVRRHKKRTRKLSSTDSEASNSSQSDEKTKSNRFLQIIEENAQDCTDLTTIQNSNESQKSLNSFFQKFETDESSQDSQTLKNLRNWKMKIRLNANEKNDKIKNHTEKIINIEEEEIVLSSDSGEESSIPDTVISKKVAPIFLKSTPKPKVDEKFEEAKKQFLLSGVPDALKRTIERRKNFEEKSFEMFPRTSHVQQKCNHSFWNLPSNITKVSYLGDTDFCTPILSCSGLISKSSKPAKLTKMVDRVKDLHSIINKIKQENPNYPVFKAFRQIYERSGKAGAEVKSDKKSSRRRSRKSCDRREFQFCKDYEMWTDKYKPRTSDDIFGNHKGVAALRRFLASWANYSDEINLRKRLKRGNSDSESEFESTDCDSRASTDLPGNTMIVGGPCGSGKTSAIYALANEFGFNVLEVNASTKRTGKRLVQELQEATQSHQVRKNDIAAALKGGKSEKAQGHESRHKKLCILLVEDIDLVFDQDDGFLTSLNQLIGTSKRPIIATTNDTSPVHVQKLLVQHEFVLFAPFGLTTLSVWLQIVCLVEGLLVDRGDIGSLLEYNKGDVRKTLLQLQFWVQSGGQLNRVASLPLVNGDDCFSNLENRITDEELVVTLGNAGSGKRCFVHGNLLGSFDIFRENCNYNVPYHFNLGTLYWNAANLLSLSDASRRRTDPGGYKSVSGDEAMPLGSLEMALSYYEALVTTDVLFTSQAYSNTSEPVLKNWSVHLKDSLELTERPSTEGSPDFAHDLAHTLINSSLERYKKCSNTASALNMALPDAKERRWRANQHACEEFLTGAISVSATLERTSVALDYLPALRAVTRSEESRAASNTKRGKRFRHYLKNFNVSFNESLCKMSASVLTSDDL
ncbi:ATPase family AAA domain-containing protein 5 [Cylas formicarius]|uniref:ATPase family AAA domain-containing protein 5 n=1 Tax=Cylas formicarius TaxID=197179 RepID=UPI002958A5F5|nr:ATPase family AAA domain-containing protein 5 [Cylas formicarius]